MESLFPLARRRTQTFRRSSCASISTPDFFSFHVHHMVTSQFNVLLQRPVLSSSSKRHLDGPAPLERPNTRSLALSPSERTTGRPRHALWTQQDARVRPQRNPRTWFWRLLVIVVVPLAAQGRRTYIASQRRPTGTALVVHLESTSSRASSGHISLGLGGSWSLHAYTATSHIVRRGLKGESARTTDISDIPHGTERPPVHRGIRFTGLTFRSAPHHRRSHERWTGVITRQGAAIPGRASLSSRFFR